MFYFAYAPEHDLDALLRWSNAKSRPSIDWTLIGRALLRDYDLCFPEYYPSVDGGRASVRPAPGRRVAGVVYDLPGTLISTLDRFIQHVYADGSHSAVPPRRLTATATRNADAATFEIATFAQPIDDGRHVPPTPESMQSLTSFATRHGHSHGWLMHLLSYTTTERDAAPILFDI